MDSKLEQALCLDRSIPEVFDVGLDVAEQRFATFGAVDPFPLVPQALLNSSDLLDYVAATGMIHPFRISMAEPTETLGPATYGVPLIGRYVYWRDSSTATGAGDSRSAYDKRVGDLNDGEELPLPPNTITYVTLEPYFRLPRYIGARFNLRVRDIYRGILVGTGPLVDPGFEGRLSVPLHNLTSNEYILQGGEPLVWMEFYKLSWAEGAWSDATEAEQPKRLGFYVAFPSSKKEQTLDDYLRKAHTGPIVSSIPAALGRAQHAAEQARSEAQEASKNAEESKNSVRNLGIGGLVLIALALGAILAPTWALIHDTNARSDDTSRSLVELEHGLQEQNAVNSGQKRALAQLRAQLRTLRANSG